MSCDTRTHTFWLQDTGNCARPLGRLHIPSPLPEAALSCFGASCAKKSPTSGYHRSVGPAQRRRAVFFADSSPKTTESANGAGEETRALPLVIHISPLYNENHPQSQLPKVADSVTHPHKKAACHNL